MTVVVPTSHNAEKEIHIAPMLDVSTREFHFLIRILSKKCVLWTEMVVDETLMYTSNVKAHLEFDCNKPIICQVGGNHPEWCGRASRLVQEFGYDGIDLNMDCPSHRVAGKREFGAILMKKTDTAAQVLKEMKRHCSIPLSVKTRIGIDNDIATWDELVAFVSKLVPVCKNFFIHARSCLLNGLSPAQNRSVPPLNYPFVYRLCDAFPECNFWINGGIRTLQQAKEICYGTNSLAAAQQRHKVPCFVCNAPNGSCTAPPPKAPVNLRGCMMGRAAMDNPCVFWNVDSYFYGEPHNPCRNRRQVLQQYCEYLEKTYPRRCCDDEAIVTTKMPAPQIEFKRPCCSVCWEFYGAPYCCERPLYKNNDTASAAGVVKISSCVIDRSLKPILGMFFQQKGSKCFRKTCHELSRDLVVRNCGPGFILRKALQSVSDTVLNLDFC